jgi:hypothetical protein
LLLPGEGQFGDEDRQGEADPRQHRDTGQLLVP